MIFSLRRKFILAGSAVCAAVFVLLPWWRNRHFLRDLYDYGLVLAANGRMAAGEQPYVDFTTPIQAGFLKLNWLVERAGGGNYAALTLGGAGLIVVMLLGLSLLLGRRWPWWAAMSVAASVTVMAASQHTILWHNSLGVFALALATWASACAPVWRRENWLWHGVLVAGLFFGGINKLNFHLIGVAVALAWAVRAGLIKQGGWGRVLASASAILIFGVVLPVVAEMWWTGATFSQWYGNVVGLAAGSRTELLWQILSADFLLKPLHDYYGTLLVGQAGLAGVIFTVVTLFGCWPRGGTDRATRWDRTLVGPAAILSAGAGAALLATNFEIAYLGVGAWLVLAVSIWLGFGADAQSRWFRFGLIMPVLVCAAGAWWSAWLGQRSQFGFSSSARADYVAADSIGSAFANLRGLRLPPEVMASLAVLPSVLPDPSANNFHPVFYGKGLEFFHRYYPAPGWKGMPLWFHVGTSYSESELEKLNQALLHDEAYGTVLVNLAYDHWPESIRETLNRYFIPDLVGPVVRRWVRDTGSSIDFSDTLQTVSRLGGNVDGRVLQQDHYPLKTILARDSRIILGTTRAVGQILVRAPAYRLRGALVADRLSASPDAVITADCKLIVHGSSPEDVRWSGVVTLPAGQQSITVPFEADLGGRQAQLWINRADQTRGAAVGLRDLEITHAVEARGGAPQVRNQIMGESGDSLALGNSLFGGLSWRPQKLVVRGGEARESGLSLPAGSESWFHTEGMAGEIRGQLVASAEASSPAMVHVVWYKGGRFQILQHCWVKHGQPAEFSAHTAEPGGWFGFVVEPGENIAPVLLRITHSTVSP